MSRSRWLFVLTAAAVGCEPPEVRWYSEPPAVIVVPGAEPTHSEECPAPAACAPQPGQKTCEDLLVDDASFWQCLDLAGVCTEEQSGPGWCQVGFEPRHLPMGAPPDPRCVTTSIPSCGGTGTIGCCACAPVRRCGGKCPEPRAECLQLLCAEGQGCRNVAKVGAPCKGGFCTAQGFCE